MSSHAQAAPPQRAMSRVPWRGRVVEFDADGESVDRGRRFRHQRRIPRPALAKARETLLAEEAQLARARTFNELFAVVEQVRHIRGLGELYAYDTCFRIGAHLGLFPDRVYLHSGTRVGARGLGLAYRKES